MKGQAYNPFLPSWEYVPDGEPHIFGDRVYLYGSHDYYNGHVFCLGDYVCWSAPINDLSDWRCEGIIYEKTKDPFNEEGKMCLYAPDITRGTDGRYYLYYVLDKVSVVSVAVCDKPAGKFEFYGYVHDKNMVKLGERIADEPQFDPAVITEGKKTYLYTGFAGPEDGSRHGAMVTVLDKDMLTILEEPQFIVPSKMYGMGTSFEGYEFFEAPSIRKKGNLYYFIYSSVAMHELCYAVSKSPVNGFTYGGVLISNCDLHVDSYKPAKKPTAYGANNHGSIIEIKDQWYVFYHRHTNGTWYSRQACAEEIMFLGDGSVKQAEMTSCGLNNGPLIEMGEYPTYIACNLFTSHDSIYVGGDDFPKIIQDGRDGDRDPGYISNIKDTATIGFKYFWIKDIKKIGIKVRGYADGYFEVRSKWDGPVLASIPVKFSNVWEEYTADIEFPRGTCEKWTIYFTYKGQGIADFLSFLFI